MELMENVTDLRAVGVYPTSKDSSEFPPNDELCENVMNIGRQIRTLYLDMKTSDGYVYDPPANLSCNFEKVTIKRAKWVTKDIFIKLFLHCTQVELSNKNFSNEDLAAIFVEWSQSSSMQYMKLHSEDETNPQKSLTDVVGSLPEALPVEKAAVRVDGMRGVKRNEFKRVSFSEGRAYRITGSDDKNYIVFYCKNYLYLTTKFEEVDTEDILPDIESNEIAWR
ncbi:hypothetical protein CAEBREN_06422 [Caenorhabditis brenneri]|uniref:F-box associated domain-containing protein n=1 Tax=Caenorhabditis brenneri TaxID=135651 RepID=G0P8G3_CAEBE|nr:hypothetical protein CAEBREN_06422 [Caenorhabditis brenneri]